MSNLGRCPRKRDTRTYPPIYQTKHQHTYIEMYWHASTCTDMMHASKCIEIHRHASACVEIHPHASACIHMHWHASRCIDIRTFVHIIYIYTMYCNVRVYNLHTIYYVPLYRPTDLPTYLTRLRCQPEKFSFNWVVSDLFNLSYIKFWLFL